MDSIEFVKFIILEDFHYLPIDTQKNFSFALKAFHENSKLCFIVVGVWREENRLIYYNGDLTGRVVSIDVDKWSIDDLKKVISAGEQLLNISFSENIRNDILSSCFESVSLVQEVCFKVCEQYGITQTSEDHITIGDSADINQIVRSAVNEQAGRYLAFINNFSEGFQQTDLEMYKWLIYTIISSDISELEVGLRRATVSSLIKAKHPNGQSLNEGNVTQALQNAASLQVHKSIRPIIIDYDQTTRVLSVVDRSFLIWLAQQDRKELLAEIDIIN